MFAGVHNIKNLDPSIVQIRKVDIVNTHPGFNGSFGSNMVNNFIMSKFKKNNKLKLKSVLVHASDMQNCNI
jgi:hypothetical protein